MAARGKVLIVGGGISGLALAIALARKDIAAEVIETTADGNILGMGITLGAPAIRAFNSIGIMDQCLALGFPHASRKIYNLAGEVLSTQHLPRLLGPGYPAQLGILRPALHRLLLEVSRDLGVVVHFARRVAEVEQKQGGVEVLLSDGGRGTYDAVIGADGIYSEMRNVLLGSDHRPKFTGLAAWRIRTPRPQEVDGIVVYRGGNHWVGFNPVTVNEGYIFIVETVESRAHLSPRQLIGRVPQMLAGYGGPVERLLPYVTDPATIVYRPIEAVMVSPPWHRGDSILIGDAVHAPAPSLASGALIAIEDAVVLAEELSDRGTVRSAFERFMKRRYERCRLVVETSLELCDWQRRGAQSGVDPDQLQAKVNTTLLEPV